MYPKGKVLFIIHDLYQDDNVLPLGPAYLAAILKKRGVEVQVYCQDIFHYTNEQLAEFLQKNEFDLIGVGFLAARFKETVIDLCHTINKHKKSAWLVLGGHGPTPIPEYVLKTTKADVIALGESEETIIDLLDCKLRGKDLSLIPGVAYWQENSFFINKERQPVRDLDSIPLPEWSLFPMDKYTTCMKLFRMEEGDKIFSLLTSRGCTNRCNFCYRMERGIRVRSIEKIVEEIRLLKERYGVNYFLINDELFLFSKKRLFDFRDALKANNLKIKFACNARVDIFDEELAECLKECGCQFLNFGMESSDQKVLDAMNKNTTVEENISAAQITRKAGIGLGLNFIWGNIGDTAESLKNNVELIKQYNTYDQLRTIRPVTPYPGSDLYYEAIKRGLISGPEDFFERFKNSDLAAVNFTDIPGKKFYELLFEANKDLILDYYNHTDKDMDSASRLIKDFYELYFEDKIKFRGARHYNK